MFLTAVSEACPDCTGILGTFAERLSEIHSPFCLGLTLTGILHREGKLNQQVWSKLDRQGFADRLASEDVGLIHAVLFNIATASEEIAAELVRLLNPDTLVSGILDSRDLGAAAGLIARLDAAHSPSSERLLSHIDMGHADTREALCRDPLKFLHFLCGLSETRTLLGRHFWHDEVAKWLAASAIQSSATGFFCEALIRLFQCDAPLAHEVVAKIGIGTLAAKMSAIPIDRNAVVVMADALFRDLLGGVDAVESGRFPASRYCANFITELGAAGCLCGLAECHRDLARELTKAMTETEKRSIASEIARCALEFVGEWCLSVLTRINKALGNDLRKRVQLEKNKSSAQDRSDRST